MNLRRRGLSPEEGTPLVGPGEYPSGQVLNVGVAGPAEPAGHSGSTVAGRGVHHDRAIVAEPPKRSQAGPVGIDPDSAFEAAHPELVLGSGIEQDRLEL